jgi:16S rRNA (guanine1207-N2)-methyltransferase
MSADADPALQALLLPLQSGALRWPAAGGWFLNARSGWPLKAQPLPGLACTQWARPEADALERDGHARVEEAAAGRYPLVLLLPPRQREAARALFARAVDHLQPGGIVLACMPNKEGAKSGEADLARLAGPLSTLSKHHCRVFWSRPLDGPADPALAADWRALDAPRRIADPRAHEGGFTSRPGLFAWDRIDPASALLAAQLPGDLRGRAADLGAGWGYLSTQLLARNPGIDALDLYEADARALECARSNLQPFAARAALGFHWHDVAAGLPAGNYDAIVSNPPFHAQGRADRPELGQAFIRAAAGALRRGGRLFLVANRHLPYEAELGAAFARVRVLADAQGFKAFEAVKA